MRVASSPLDHANVGEQASSRRRGSHPNQQQESASPPPPTAAAQTKRSKRGVTHTDAELLALARQTSSRLDWGQLTRASLLTADSATRSSDLNDHHVRLIDLHWQLRATAGAFAVYDKEDSQRQAVLATGVVPCSVPELLRALQPAQDEQDECARMMEALHGAQLRREALLHDVDLTTTENAPGRADFVELSVKAAEFRSETRWTLGARKWLYLDALHRRDSGRSFAKHLTALEGLTRKRGPALHHIVAGFLVQPEPVPSSDEDPDHHHHQQDAPPQTQTQTQTPNQVRAMARPTQLARLDFYAELPTPRQPAGLARVLGPTAASSRVLQTRLLAMAQSCERLPAIIRRRRLGVQVLVNVARVLSKALARCVDCDARMVLAKLCRLCGQGVCESCSAKHDRERRDVRTGRTLVDSVRVCHCCMARVDSAEYSELCDTSLMSPQVVPNAVDSPTAAHRLIALLHDALLAASSPGEKAYILGVIRCVLDQDELAEEGDARSSTRRQPPMRLTPSSDEQDHVEALRQTLTVPQPSFTDCALASDEGRSYQLHPSRNMTEQMPYPTPENEEDRVRFIAESKIREMGRVEELDILCHLAARELSCFATMVTVIDREDQYIAAVNQPWLEGQVFARTDTFCQHGIMSNQPLIVPHPEADVRFHRLASVQHIGARFYCGFPVVAEADTVIGTLCCVHTASLQITETQYATLKKLAQTASRIIKLRLQRKREGYSNGQEERPNDVV